MNFENQRGFRILEAILSSDRNGASVDIAPSISDFDIYEHLDKPYLTATIVFLDMHGVMQLIDMQGIEKLSLKIESSTSKNVISKVFRLVKVLKSHKSDDRSELITFDAVEEHAYISNAININRSYIGTPASIISTVAKEHLAKEVIVTDTTYQGNMKVIVPNMNPIETIKWIQKRATNDYGLPYYAYSILSDNNLRFSHLGTMLTQAPNNEERPYVYSQAPSKPGNALKEFFVIETYSQEQNENMFQLIKDGYSGARYHYYNTANGYSVDVDFDAKKDVFDELLRGNYLSKQQDDYSFPVGTKINGIPLNEKKTKVITRIASSNMYNSSGDFKTYGEEIDAEGYKKNICGHALKQYLTKSTISIGVRGAPYIANGHLTIGTTVRMKFFDSKVQVDRSNLEIGIDTKKSGDYIIYAAKHSFKTEKYDLNLLCTKIANYTGENL